MVAEAWKPGVVYLQHTSKDGSSYCAEHTCWNTDLFLENAQEAAKEAKGSAVQVSREHYLRNAK